MSTNRLFQLLTRILSIPAWALRFPVRLLFLKQLLHQPGEICMAFLCHVCIPLHRESHSREVIHAIKALNETIGERRNRIRRKFGAVFYNVKP